MSQTKNVKLEDLDPEYRPCVGIMLLNNDGLVLIAKRVDLNDMAWQMPQGGIDAGESPAEAAMRELEEELGTASAEIIAECPRWLQYDLPPEYRRWKGKYKGQTQRWFAMRFTGSESEIQPQQVETPEFSDWKWVPMATVPSLIIEFKRDIYDAVVAEFGGLSRPL